MNRLPNIRFHPERDSDLIEWVESLSNLPNGIKGEAVKDVLRTGLEKKMPTARLGAAQAPEIVEPEATKANRPSQTHSHLTQLDIPSLIEALRNEFLADIRTIVDASISQSLEGITIGTYDAEQAPNQETEAEDILDSFADLMLE